MILNLREVPLAEAAAEKKLRSLANVHLVVQRSQYKLDLYSDTTLVKSYRAVFGKNNSSRKNQLEPYKTPVGKYLVCAVDSSSRYKRFLKINFPNSNDVTQAYNAGLITESDYEVALDDLQNNVCPVIARLKLPEIGIHGNGRLNFILKNLPFVYNWTNGSVAVSDENIDEIYSVIKVGTEVEIKE